jgi:hypothetical protein
LKSAVLLDVESFVFDLPAAASAEVGQGHDRLGTDGPVGQPGEEFGILARFLVALQGIDRVPPLLVVDMFELFDPGKSLFGPFIRAVGLAILGAQLQQSLVVGPEGRERTFLEGDKVLPAVVPADVQHRAVGVEAVIAVAYSLLKVCYHLLRQPEVVHTDLGADYFERQKNPEREAQRMVRRLQRLGYTVDLHRLAA